jgi:three-Cys-motif partner protein
MKNYKNLWNITERVSTKRKLEVLRKCFEIWLTIWNKQAWVGNEWYIMDLFAGRGKYTTGESGSPLIFLETIAKKLIELEKKKRKIKLFLVEQNDTNYKQLQKNINDFIRENKSLENIIEIHTYNDDCNIAIDKIINSINNAKKYPLFILIDPTGLQIKKATMQNIVRLDNYKDILFNYILEGVRRTSGVLKKGQRGELLTVKELKTIETLKSFIGNDTNYTATYEDWTR